MWQEHINLLTVPRVPIFALTSSHFDVICEPIC